MKSNKLLRIYEGYFNLPDDFNGTFGEALMLMANRAKEAEVYDEVNVYYDECFDLYGHLKDNDKTKCIIRYEIVDC